MINLTNAAGVNCNFYVGKGRLVHLRSEHLSVSPGCDPALQTFLESELSLLMKFEWNFM